MYQEKENILPAMKAIAKTASSYIPVVNCAINFYEEKKSQVVQRKLQRLGDFLDQGDGPVIIFNLHIFCITPNDTPVSLESCRMPAPNNFADLSTSSLRPFSFTSKWRWLLIKQ